MESFEMVFYWHSDENIPSVLYNVYVYLVRRCGPDTHANTRLRCWGCDGILSIFLQFEMGSIWRLYNVTWTFIICSAETMTTGLILPFFVSHPDKLLSNSNRNVFLRSFGKGDHQTDTRASYNRHGPGTLANHFILIVCFVSEFGSLVGWVCWLRSIII